MDNVAKRHSSDKAEASSHVLGSGGTGFALVHAMVDIQMTSSSHRWCEGRQSSDEKAWNNNEGDAKVLLPLFPSHHQGGVVSRDWELHCGLRARYVKSRSSCFNDFEVGIACHSHALIRRLIFFYNKNTLKFTARGAAIGAVTAFLIGPQNVQGDFVFHVVSICSYQGHNARLQYFN